MREVGYDLRANAALVFLKVAVTVLVLVCFYNIVSLSQSTDEAIDRSFSGQSGYELYRLSDTLSDPSLFQAFRDSPEKVASVGAFYDALNNDDELLSLSAFNQPLPIVDFKGGEEFRYAYGTGMPNAGLYQDPLGRSVVNIKSLQINRHVFDFYGLRVEEGDSIDWNRVDYAADEIPVLLGHSFKGVYGLGDKLPGWLYGHEKLFEVAGFLEANSAVYYHGEANYYLDESVVVPYPASLAYDSFPDKELYGIVSFAAVNSDLAVQKKVDSKSVLTRLSLIGQASGFQDYTLLNVPDYLVQLTLMRQIIEDNFALVALIQVLLSATAFIVIVVIDQALCNRRKRKTALWMIVGDDSMAAARRHWRLWSVEYAARLVCLLLALWLLPNQNGVSLLTALGALVCFVFVDALVQRLMLAALLRRT